MFLYREMINWLNQATILPEPFRTPLPVLGFLDEPVIEPGFIGFWIDSVRKEKTKEARRRRRDKVAKVYGREEESQKPKEEAVSPSEKSVADKNILIGQIEECLEESIRVEGSLYLINSFTAILGSPATGEKVALKYRKRSDGSLQATKITVMMAP